MHVYNETCIPMYSVIAFAVNNIMKESEGFQFPKHLWWRGFLKINFTYLGKDWPDSVEQQTVHSDVSPLFVNAGWT